MGPVNPENTVVRQYDGYRSTTTPGRGSSETTGACNDVATARFSKCYYKGNTAQKDMQVSRTGDAEGPYQPNHDQGRRTRRCAASEVHRTGVDPNLRERPIPLTAEESKESIIDVHQMLAFKKPSGFSSFSSRSSRRCLGS